MSMHRNPYLIESDIKRAWVAAVISATITLAISIFVVLTHRPFYGVSAWTLFDAAFMYGLAIGVHRRSRMAGDGRRDERGTWLDWTAPRRAGTAGGPRGTAVAF